MVETSDQNFPVIVHVTSASAVEPLGTKQKWWFANHQTLFKANYEQRGEDWAEVITADLCQVLGLPHVEYSFANAHLKRDDGLWDYQRGVITDTMFERGTENLIDGDQLLLARDANYPSGDRYKLKQYTVKAVSDAIAGLALPPERFCSDLPDVVTTANGVFSGYLMLDALVANQDRHHQNWGAIDDGECKRLTPTFDHGAALAPAGSDEKRSARLTTTDPGYSVAGFAERAKSPFWESDGTKKLKLIPAWLEFADSAKNEAQAWVHRLERLDRDAILACIGRVPDDIMSETTREFCLQLLLVNAQRIRFSWNKNK